MRTKQCLFCAETIQAEAIKCRFCGEFLNTPQAKALKAAAEADEDEDFEGEEGTEGENILFAGRPSLWGIVGDMGIGAFFCVIGGLIVRLPIERMLGMEMTLEQASMVAQYRFLAGLGVICVVIAILAVKTIRLKMIYYEVTPDRIEWSRGILDRRVDNVDMFRVIDLNLRRSLIDCIMGVGTVGLITTDKSDPEFEFEKVRGCRVLYDAIKKASLEADRNTGVVHLE
ncbi:MAG: PH domain-containing protein [Planctomycetota bacterium]